MSHGSPTDRTETTAHVWLGLTANCAVCHDHKFDPLTQREFYELSAFVNNTTQPVRDGNVKDTPPIVTVPQDADRERWLALQQELPAAQTQLSARRQTAQFAVRPSQTYAVVSVRSRVYRTLYSSSMMPPSLVVMLQRWKPEAIL